MKGAGCGKGGRMDRLETSDPLSFPFQILLFFHLKTLLP